MTGIPERLLTALADRYRIERQLGEGGMATVYLAEDLKHDRRVALKVLKPELAAVLGGERFVVEIKTTASLQHPHILPLFDSGTADGFLYYVMPFVEGETLRNKLDRETQLGVEDAIRITTEVADALDYAHRHGVIHRDIKPANILMHDGRPTVADFGIALAVSAAAGGRMTETGLSLGTPFYMSPEQATAEKEITARSDVYSLGCVLYEMLTGNPPHTGASAQQIIMKIVSEEAAPVTDVRKAAPPNVAAAVAKALEKLPADRFGSAKEFAEALADPNFLLPRTSTGVAPGASPRRKLARIALVAVAIPLAFAAGLALSDDSEPVLRLGLDLPQGQTLVGEPSARLAIAPDGLRFVYVGEGEGGSGSRLWTRDLRRQGATGLEGTDGASAPSFSPDGQRVAFVRDGAVFVVNQAGDPPIMLTDGLDYGAWSVDWGPDGFIYFGGRGIFRVSDEGGEIEQVVRQDDERRLHLAPRVLPNGRGIVFALGQTETWSDNVIALADLETRELKVLTPGVAAGYAESGHLLVVRANGQLDVAPFEQRGLDFSGPPRTVGTGIGIGERGGVDLAISKSGTLLYTTGVQEPRRQVVLVDEGGFEKPMEVGWTGPWESVVLSPDERQLLVGTGFGASPQLWVRTLESGQMTRLTTEGELNRRPVWSEDGKTVTFISHRGEFRAVYRKRADGVGSAEPVLELSEHVDEVDWSPGEEWLVYRTGMTGGEGRDIHAWHVGGDSGQVAIAANPTFDERSPSLSPDGQWLAYTAFESGTSQVYVRSFPDADRFRIQISVGTGRAPVWSSDGRALFYVEGDGSVERLVAVTVRGDSAFSVERRRELFRTEPYFVTGTASAFDYWDGDEAFVMIRRDESMAQGDLILIRNFFADPTLSGSEGR